MNKLIIGGLWGEIKRFAKKSKISTVAVAYVASENVNFSGWPLDSECL